MFSVDPSVEDRKKYKVKCLCLREKKIDPRPIETMQSAETHGRTHLFWKPSYKYKAQERDDLASKM